MPLLIGLLTALSAPSSGADEASIDRDLARMPAYRPQITVQGVLRAWGSTQMSGLLQQWQRGFQEFHPQASFENRLRGTASGMIGLEESVADLVLMARPIVPYETYGIWRRSHLLPRAIEVATGSFDVPGKSAAYAIYVHHENPLSRLTLRQLDGIFGAQRSGGWQMMKWEPGAARSERDNIRSWGALGLTGPWTSKRIHPYGPPGLHPGGMSYFQMRVLEGGDLWSETLMEYADRPAMLRALRGDRHGIAYAGHGHPASGLKTLALAERPGGPFVELTRENVRTRAYPLARPVYIYFAPDFPSGDPRPELDPKLLEFLRYVLSRQGQAAVNREGEHLPLTADNVLRQRELLQAPPAVLKRLSP